MKTIEQFVPQEATPTEAAVIVIHMLFPHWSKKKIADILRYKNHQRPRAVQRVFTKYKLTIIERI